jgi:hypothetical protein
LIPTVLWLLHIITSFVMVLTFALASSKHKNPALLRGLCLVSAQGYDATCANPCLALVRRSVQLYSAFARALIQPFVEIVKVKAYSTANLQPGYKSVVTPLTDGAELDMHVVSSLLSG